MLRSSVIDNSPELVGLRHHPDVVTAVVRPLPARQPRRRADQIKHIADKTQMCGPGAARDGNTGPEALELLGLADDAASQRVS